MCPFIQELPFGAILFGVYESFKIPQATFIYYFVGVYELFQIDQATFICWSRQSLVGHKLLQVIIIIKLDFRNLHWICWLAIIKLGHLLVSFYSRSCTELHCNALVNSLAAPGPLAAGAGDLNWQTEMGSTTVSEETPDLQACFLFYYYYLVLFQERKPDITKLPQRDGIVIIVTS